MKPDRSGRTAPLALALLVALALAVPASTILAEESMSFWGRTKVATPEPSDEGDFNGTWWFHSKDHKVALWIVEQDGVRKIRMRLMVLHTTESVTTDWEGEGNYVFRGKQGRLSIGIEDADDNLLAGDWHWELTRKEWKRVETAKIKLYRIGNGRSMAVLFDNFDRTYEGGAKAVTFDTEQQLWVFMKASRRTARWEELPF